MSVLEGALSKPRIWSMPGLPGQPNEDAVFVRDGVAVVVDGAGLPQSMRAGCHHAVDWYASRLASTFGAALLNRGTTMPEALSQAITQVSELHDGCRLDEGSPSATVAAWRVNSSAVEYLVLCDASALILGVDGAIEATDERLAVLTAQHVDQVAAATAVGGRLTAVQVLDARRAVLERSRNVDGGFWCCQTDPGAADHVLGGSYPLSKVAGIAIATDGATRGYQSLGVHTLQQFAEDAVAGDGASLLRQVRAAERQQRQRLLDRAVKVHDDATLVALNLAGPES